MSAKKIWMPLAVLVLLLLAGVILPRFNTVRMNSATDAWRSPAELNRLREQVKTKRDANAAMTIQHYYERNKHDPALSYLWLQRAADLGNESARGDLERLENGDAEIRAEVDAWAEKGRKKEASEH